MKLKYVPVALFLGALSLLISSYSAGYTNTSGGDNRTGSTGSVGCGGGGCHSSAATAGITVTVQLQSAGVTVTSYHPGASYTVKLTGTNTTTGNLPDFGFGLSTVKAAGAGTSAAVQAGSWGTLPSGTQVIPTTTSLLVAEHQVPAGATTGGGATGSTYVQVIPWVAPVAGTGSVAIYGVVNAVNGDNNANSADKWNSATLTVTEAANGIDDLSDRLNALKVYPTLMNSSVNITMDVKEPSVLTTELISMDGQVVKALMSNESLSAGPYHGSYDVNGLAAGVYLLRVQIGSSSTVSKVVKQ